MQSLRFFFNGVWGRISAGSEPILPSTQRCSAQGAVSTSGRSSWKRPLLSHSKRDVTPHCHPAVFGRPNPEPSAGHATENLGGAVRPGASCRCSGAAGCSQATWQQAPGALSFLLPTQVMGQRTSSEEPPTSRQPRASPKTLKRKDFRAQQFHTSQAPIHFPLTGLKPAPKAPGVRHQAIPPLDLIATRGIAFLPHHT